MVALACGMALSCHAAEQRQPPRTTLLLARRAAILLLPPPAAGDASVQRVLAEAREARQPRGDSAPEDAAAIAPEEPPALPESLAGTEAQRQREIALALLMETLAAHGIEPPAPSALAKARDAMTAQIRELIHPVAAALLADALAARLRDALGAPVVSDGEVEAALRAEGLSPSQAATAEGARRLCARLDCDALLVVRMPGWEVREGALREARLRAEIRLRCAIPEQAVSSALAGSGLPPLAEPPQALPVGGAAVTGKPLFGSDYSQNLPQLASEAAQAAARYAAHALLTGESDPFARPGTRVAVLPVAAPAQMDRLFFSPQGRRVQIVAAPRWQPGAGFALRPNLLPLAAENILTPETGQVSLRSGPQETAAFWTAQDAPDVARMQEIGKRLRADYVLAARVTGLEASDSPPAEALREQERKGAASNTAVSSSQPVILEGTGTHAWERMARAEVVGACIEVGTGRILWQERATATMTARSRRNGRPIPLTSEADVTRDAIRYALLQLQRQFTQYRAQFAQ